MSRGKAWNTRFFTSLFGDRRGRRRSNRLGTTRSPAHRLQLESLETRALFSATAATYSVSSEWGSGFQAQIELSNSQTSALNNWSLSFDFSRQITSIWDATIVSHVGAHYVISGDSWDSSIPAGGSLAFGFIGAGSSVGVAPANYALNGAPLGGSTPTEPSLSVSDVTATQGASGTTAFSFNVTLSAASTAPITVNYATANGTAQAGLDYKAASGTLTFAAGQTSKTVTVASIADVAPGTDRTFYLNLSAASGATLAKSQGVGTIDDALLPVSTPVASYAVTGSWQGGFEGQITVTNTSQQTLNDWRLQFNFAGQITSLWDGSILSHSGNVYVIQSASWEGDLASGASATFGFNGGSGVSAIPSGFRLFSGANGAMGGTVNHAPTPQSDAFLINPGQATVLNVLANDTDPDGDGLDVTSITQPSHGVASLNSNGTITYTPAAGYTGADSLTYTVSDGRGGTATASVSLNVGTPAATVAWPSQFFAPYYDVTLDSSTTLQQVSIQSGVKFFTLAFITANSSNAPAWGGYDAYTINGGAFDMALRQQVATLRAAGGDVMPSFGGEAGTELAQAITNVTQLTAAYQTVITDYNLTKIDFDIEGAAEADHASIDRRSEALAALQQAAVAAGRSLDIWFTLPALPTGLTADGLYVLQSALAHGVKIAGVNLMTMDFGESVAPNPAGNMGTYSIDAAQSLYGQLQTLYGTSKTSAQLWQMIGVTPMIGVNDDTNEVFDQAAAAQLVAFAQKTGMGRISMWSLNRDTAGAAKSYVDDTSSSINQTADQFSKIFEQI